MATKTPLNGTLFDLGTKYIWNLWLEVKPHVAASEIDKNIFMTQYFKFLYDPLFKNK